MDGDSGANSKPAKWRPSFSDLVAAGGVVVTVIMWFRPPSWEIGLPLTIITAAVVIFTAWRHQSHPLLRGSIAAAVVILLAVVAGDPIWISFHKDYPRAAFNWPFTLNQPPVLPQDPPDMPPLNLPGPTLSKWGKSLFFCQFLPDTASQNSDAVLAEIRRNFDIVGNATGLSLIINEIPYGFRVDVTANAPEGQLQMGALVQRFTIQIERASKGIFVTVSFDIGALGILTMMPVDSESQKMLAKVVTEFTGIPEDKCRML